MNQSRKVKKVLISRPQGNKEFRTHRKEKRQELDIMTNLCELQMGGLNWNNLKKSNFKKNYNSFFFLKKFLSQEYRRYESSNEIWVETYKKYIRLFGE